MGTYGDLLKPTPILPSDSATDRQGINTPVSPTPSASSKVVVNSEDTLSRTSERSSARTVFRAESRTQNRTVFPLPYKRRTKRYSFEFYEDQLVKLRQLKIQAEMSGQSLSQSNIVREALDQYLNDKDA
jgi:hypothetical protein